MTMTEAEANAAIPLIQARCVEMETPRRAQIAGWRVENTTQSNRHADRLESLLGWTTDPLCYSCELRYDSAGDIIGAHHSTISLADLKRGLMEGWVTHDADHNISVDWATGYPDTDPETE